MDMNGAEKDVEIAVGVLSALAVLLSAVEAWSWSKRLIFELFLVLKKALDLLLVTRLINSCFILNY